MGLKLINYIILQIGWFACVLSSAKNNYVLPLTIASLAIAFNLIFHKPRKPEIKFIIGALAVGVAFEFSVAYFQMFQYLPSDIFPPIWILCLWLLLATTFSFSMNWTISYPIVGVLLAAVLGPLSYWPAETLGALSLAEDFWPHGYAVLSVHWGAATLALILLYRFFHKMSI